MVGENDNDPQIDNDVVKIIFVSILTFSVMDQVYSQDFENEIYSSLMNLNHEDYLEPSSSYFDLSNKTLNYYNSLDSIFFKYVSSDPVIRMIVIPSFEPEYLISIDIVEENYFITCVELSSNWYMNKFDSRNEVKVNRLMISCDLAECLRDLYQLSLDGIRSDKNHSIGIDGCYYYFSSSWRNRVRTGFKWSPNEGSKISDLIALTNRLKHKDTLNEDELISDIFILINRFLRSR